MQVFGDLCIVSYWIDTLVLKLREILISTLLHHPFLFKGKTNTSSRSSNHLDSCAGCVFRERTIEQAEELLNDILNNYDDWTLPEPLPKPTSKKRGILFLSPEDMQEANKCMK